MGSFGFLSIRDFLVVSLAFSCCFWEFLQFILQERLHKELLGGLYGKHCHLQIITFFPILQIIGSEVTKHHNYFFICL